MAHPAPESAGPGHGGIDPIVVCTAIAAALPTLAYAAWSPSLIVDDWGLAAKARFLGWSDSVQWYRPIGGIWVRLAYVILGESPVAQALLMALLNAVAGGLLWMCAKAFLPRRVALLTTSAWVVMANRGSTRLWAITGPIVLSLIMLLAAVVLVRYGKVSLGTHAVVIVLAASSVLAYEGAGGFAAAVVVLSAWRWGWAVRVIAGGIGLFVLFALAASALLISPKVSGARPFAGATRWPSALLGVGILPTSLAAAALVWVAAMVWSAATVLLPSFSSELEERAILVGGGIALLGAAPFIVSGFPVGTDGLFDRATIYPDIGIALVIGATLGLVFRVGVRWGSARWAGPAVSVAVLTCLAVQNVVDVRAFHDAGVDGRRLLASIDAMPAEVRTHGPLVLPDLPNRSGVSMFVEDYDISAALALRYNTGYPYPDATMQLDAWLHVRHR